MRLKGPAEFHFNKTLYQPISLFTSSPWLKVRAGATICWRIKRNSLLMCDYTTLRRKNIREYILQRFASFYDYYTVQGSIHSRPFNVMNTMVFICSRMCHSTEGNVHCFAVISHFLSFTHSSSLTLCCTLRACEAADAQKPDRHTDPTQTSQFASNVSC